jgi:uncharacterized protein
VIIRRRLKTLERLLDRSPAVVMLGPRQSGKTTLARAIAEQRGPLTSTSKAIAIAPS